MLSVQQAEAKILDLVQPLRLPQDQQSVDLQQAHGRILAETIIGDRNFPYWDNSAMDGYAVRSQDLQTVPVSLQVVSEIPAGTQPQVSLEPGQAARIFTGSMLPDGADTVVIQEHTQRQANQVIIQKSPAAGANIRQQGAFYQAGTPLLPPGISIQAPEIAVLATVQCIQVPVWRRPVVAVLSNGNELIAPDQPLQPGQIIDSNQWALTALLAQAGMEVQSLGRVGDRQEDLQAAIQGAIATADVIISSGGVSVGDYDHVESVLEQLGADIHIRSVAVKPGKPLTVATLPAIDQAHARSILYFGLPGNPVSALVSCWRFVLPALHKLAGLAADWGPSFVPAIAQQDLQGDGQRETYLWGRLVNQQGQYQFDLAGGSHSSGNLINLAQTNGLAMLPCDRSVCQAGEIVQVLAMS